MDRKGWIILILCSLGLVFLYTRMQEQNRELIEHNQKVAAEQKAKDDAKKSESAPTSSGEGQETEASAEGEIQEASKETEEKLFYLTTKDEEGDVVKYTFSNKGGGIKEAHLLAAYEGIDKEVIINKYGPYTIGEIATDDGEMESSYYPVDEVKQTERSISFTRVDSSGLKITKTWELAEESENSHEYRIKLNVALTNTGESKIKLKDYSVTSGINAPLFEDEQAQLCKWFYFQDGEFDSGSQSPFVDGWFGFGKAREIEVLSVVNLQYAGVSNQFYTTIMTPSEPGQRIWVDDKMVKLDSAEEKVRSYYLGVAFPDKDLSKGDSNSFKFDFYTGPRKQSDIVKLGENTDETMSYGFWLFSFGAPFANTAINWIHDTVAVHIHEGWSWGIAIVILTICIRIVIWPLHNKSTRTMKRMSKLQPHMKEIREKHGDNPQKVQQETLKLYKKYKVNPMGGCLPMLIQMPIFFAVFGMLTNAVELRGEGFLWVKDLSYQEDIFTIPWINMPFNILPFTMALTMIFQMRMTPQSGDQLQRRIFMFLPVVFFFFCYGYASALALYWTVQNIISIGQTWLMKRLPEPELEEVEVKPGNEGKPRKKGWMERMAEKVEEAQQQRETAMATKTGRAVPKQKKQPEIPGQKPAKEKKRGPKTGG